MMIDDHKHRDAIHPLLNDSYMAPPAKAEVIPLVVSYPRKRQLEYELPHSFIKESLVPDGTTLCKEVPAKVELFCKERKENDFLVQEGVLQFTVLMGGKLVPVLIQLDPETATHFAQRAVEYARKLVG